MPKTRQKIRGIGKPMNRGPRKTAPRPPKPPREQRTPEQVLEKLAECINEAETLMGKAGRPAFRPSNPFQYPALHEIQREYGKLGFELENLMRPDFSDQGALSEAYDALIAERFADPPGVVPRWSRSGKFILWMDYVPLMIVWHGILHPDMTAFAVDPKLPFLRDPQATGRPKDIEAARALPSSGYLGLGGWLPIGPKVGSVLQHVQLSLLEKQANLLLRPLSDAAKVNVADTLDAMPWIAEALQQQPYRMPLPQHLSVQTQSLFD
jgi:hypothetical protein